METIVKVFKSYGIENNPLLDLINRNEQSDFITDSDEFELQDNTSLGGNRLIGVTNLQIDYDFLEDALVASLQSADLSEEYRELYTSLLEPAEKDEIVLDKHEYYLITFYINNDDMLVFVDKDMNVLLTQYGDVNVPVSEAIDTLCNLSISAAL